MNSQNSYILIFNKNLNKKKFIKLFFLINFSVLILSFFLNKNSLFRNENDLIKDYQFSKIHNENFSQTRTIIVGDSSAGNVIDNKYFEKLSEQKTENLALTGSWGIAGSLGIVKEAYDKNNNIKNVILIQTFGIWTRSFPYQAMFKLYPFNEAIEKVGLYEYITYSFNPKVFWWNIKDLIKLILGESPGLDMKTDYLEQSDNKFSNNMKLNTFDSELQNTKINQDKIDEIKSFENFCSEKNLNCIFLSGPIHASTYEQSIKYINIVNNFIQNNLNIKFSTNVFKYDSKYIGDNLDHIDPKYKDISTEDYFNTIKELLK